CILAGTLALFAFRLGRLDESWNVYTVLSQWAKSLGDDMTGARMYQNWAWVALTRGRLASGRVLAGHALAAASEDEHERAVSVGYLAAAAHFQGDTQGARLHFRQIVGTKEEPVFVPVIYCARHLIDVGSFTDARSLCDRGLAQVETAELRSAASWL